MADVFNNPPEPSTTLTKSKSTTTLTKSKSTTTLTGSKSTSTLTESKSTSTLTENEPVKEDKGSSSTNRIGSSSSSDVTSLTDTETSPLIPESKRVSIDHSPKKDAHDNIVVAEVYGTNPLQSTESNSSHRLSSANTSPHDQTSGKRIAPSASRDLKASSDAEGITKLKTNDSLIGNSSTNGDLEVHSNGACNTNSLQDLSDQV